MEASKILTSAADAAARYAGEGGARCRTGLAYALVAGVIGLGLFASVTPSPLYRAYSVLWHFSPLTLTLIYATYAFGVLASLLLAGGVSDHVGRRPVLLVALGRADGVEPPLPLRRLRRLALRRPRHPGPRHRRSVERGQRGAARPASAPRPCRGRAHQRDRRDRRHRARASSSPRRSSRSAGNRGSCPTSCSSSSSRSPWRVPTGCPSRCSSAHASGSPSPGRASRPSSAAPSSSPLSPSSPPGRSARSSSRSARSSPGTCSTRATRSCPAAASSRSPRRRRSPSS